MGKFNLFLANGKIKISFKKQKTATKVAVEINYTDYYLKSASVALFRS